MITLLIEKALNLYLRLDPESAKQLHGLQGRSVKVKLTDLPISFFLLFSADKVQVLHSYSNMPEAVIEGKSVIFLTSKLIQTPIKSIQVRGNVELGYEVYGLLNNVEIDWEEHLSHYVGDVIAHPIGNLARGIASALKGGRKSLRENVTEYLQEEASLLPSRQEIEGFCGAVELSRQQLERLEAYLKKAGVL